MRRHLCLHASGHRPFNLQLLLAAATSQIKGRLGPLWRHTVRNIFPRA